MYVVMNRISVPAEHAPTFERLFTASFEHLRGVSGLERVTLQRPSKPDQPYVSTMEFDTPESFRAWMSSGSFRASHAVPEGTPREAMGTNSLVETFETISDITY